MWSPHLSIHHSARWPLAPATLALLLALSFAGSASGQFIVRQLNLEGVAGSNVVTAHGKVSGPQVSPDGKWIVYAHDPEVAGSYALWAAPRRGGPAVRLSGALPPGTEWTGRFIFTPDSRRVIYQLDQETLGRTEAWSVPVGGPAGEGVKLNPELPPNGDVLEAVLSEAGDRVVLLLTEPVDAAYIYAVPPEGPASAAIPLDGPVVAGGEWRKFFYALPGRTFFVADAETDDVDELWSAPLDIRMRASGCRRPCRPAVTSLPTAARSLATGSESTSPPMR